MFLFSQFTSREEAVRIIKVSFINAEKNSTFNCTAVNSFAVIDGLLLMVSLVLQSINAPYSMC